MRNEYVFLVPSTITQQGLKDLNNDLSKFKIKPLGSLHVNSRANFTTHSRVMFTTIVGLMFTTRRHKIMI